MLQAGSMEKFTVKLHSCIGDCCIKDGNGQHWKLQIRSVHVLGATGRLVWAASLDMIHTCSNAGQDRDAVNVWTFVPCNYSYSPCIPCASRMLPF